jgi:hypothetical protein
VTTSGHRCDIKFLEYALEQDEHFKTHFINVCLNDEYLLETKFVKKDMFLA